MDASFTIDRARNTLLDAAGRRFAPAERRWLAASRRKPSAGKLEMIDAIGAVGWLQRESGSPLREPIGVIGPREADAAQLAAALEVGELLADCRLAVLCGGRGGVMQAVCEGVARVGGLSIGLLPETDASQANPFVSVAIATGIGEARNALIARASFCLIAIGNSLGTLSEVALGLHFGKPVIGLEQAAELAGVQRVGSARAAVATVAETILAPR
ncbi:MAG TPA: hypothetical protein VL742_16200 [Casimicrobiaceae bacterium]|nr:hypothetical protein [Casimicrobiaceae bacterium]